MALKTPFFFKLDNFAFFLSTIGNPFLEAHFGCTFWKEDENIKKKVHSMYIDNDVESRRTKPTVAGHSLNRKVLLSFQFR